MLEIYKDGELYVWIPVAVETDKYAARAFLPFNGLNETYLHGYKANISEAKYLDALCDIQKAFINNESKIFSVKGGSKDERQYKAKWRHGRQRNSPLLGPTKGWVKIMLNAIHDVKDIDLAEALNSSGSTYCELVGSSICPVLCDTDTELIVQAERLKNIIGVRIPAGQKTPKKSSYSQEGFVRDAAVLAYVLKEANGVCECCKERAPFIKANGEPFLEGHHVKHLAKGGSDTISNAITVCPNCHRELHHGENNTVLAEKLYLNVMRLIRE